MPRHKQQISQKSSSRKNAANYLRKEFLKRYSKQRKQENWPLDLQLLIEIEHAVVTENIDSLKFLSMYIAHMSDQHMEQLQIFYNDSRNPLRNTNLIILSCKHKSVKVMKYLLSSENEVLFNLYHTCIITPTDEDEEKHNAFYYAIRSCKVEIVELLVNKWPDNYFISRPEIAEKLVANAYEELNLKDVLLSDEISVFIENQLLRFRFFSNSEHVKNDIFMSDITERIDLVLESVNLLNIEYDSTSEVDEKFLYILKCIAKNIHILKRQLKATYDVIPWEEIEFCLIAFVDSYRDYKEIHFIYSLILTEHNLLKYLETFAACILEIKRNLKTMDINKLAQLPNLKRESIVKEISVNSVVFADLYCNYKSIRDIHSLETMCKYISLTLSTDINKDDDNILLVRTLQVVGEYLKNTLESPKLSDSTSELFLCLLPCNFKKILYDMRNSLSHVYTLENRSEIGKKIHDGLLWNIQHINDVLTIILYQCKLKVMATNLKKIVNSKTLAEVEDLAKTYRLTNQKTILQDIIQHSHFKMIRYYRIIENLWKEVRETWRNRNMENRDFEVECFREIEMILDYEKDSCAEEEIYVKGIVTIYGLQMYACDHDLNENVIKGIKYGANEILKEMTAIQNTNSIERIVDLLLKIQKSSKFKNENEIVNKINTILYSILQFMEFGTRNVKWIEELRNQINPNKFTNVMCTSVLDQNKVKPKGQKCSLLREKLQILREVLQRSMPNTKLLENFPCSVNEKKFEVLIEMLLLDIMSVLGDSLNCLTTNQQYLDENCAILIGKNLRNYLAHGNVLSDILLFKPSTTLVLNAMALVDHNVINGNRNIGKISVMNGLLLREKFNKDMITLGYQKNIFDALVKGDPEAAQNYITNGADIYGRSNELYTTLHFAAKGPSVRALEFVLSHSVNINAKDIWGQTALHVAAKYGRKFNVEYLIQNTEINVDDTDNMGKTCLHVAAQNGFIDIVIFLLQNKANSNVRDSKGFLPLHYAVKNNYKNIVCVLLEREQDVDDNEVLGGFTLLHIAAENGHIELVNMFLNSSAKVNAKTDQCAIPLHLAALHGHFNVVKVLIASGANVNAKSVNGSTPLHNAVEYGHRNVVEFLLEHGACANIVGGFNHTPLSFAAISGEVGILQNLLTKGADVNLRTVEGQTPLHCAAAYGHLKAVDILLKNNALVNGEDFNGQSSLHISAQIGRKNIINLLVEYGANVNAITKNYMTPLHIAVLEGEISIVEMLIQLGSFVNVCDDENRTPLHFSCLEGYADVTKILLENNACVNAQDIQNRSPLHFAVKSGNLDTVKTIITKDAALCMKDAQGYTAMHYAAQYGWKEIVEVLIKTCADLNAKSNCSETPLHLAADKKHKEIVHILLANGANINAKTDAGDTPLYTAVHNDNREIVSALIHGGIDLSTSGKLLLMHAVTAGYTDIVKILIKNIKNIEINMCTFNNMTLLCIAASRGYRTIVEILLEKGADVNVTSEYENLTPLHMAVAAGYCDIVELLLFNNAAVNAKAADGSTALHAAAILGHAKIVCALLHSDVDINQKDDKNRTCIELAVVFNKREIVETLVTIRDININAKGSDNFTLLHIAAQFGHLDMTKFLVDLGAEVCSRNSYGSLPIHIAAREGHVDIVDFYVANHLNINICNGLNQTLLHCAAVSGNTEVVKYLINKRIDVNASDVKDVRPIHLASKAGFKEIVLILLENGAFYDVVDMFNQTPLVVAENNDIVVLLKSTKGLLKAAEHGRYTTVLNNIKEGAVVNVRNSSNATALHFAASQGHNKILEVLLANKANTNLIDKHGYTPLHYATKFSHVNIVRALLSNGAIYNAKTENQETPLDFAVNKEIIDLFKMIHNFFIDVQNSNTKVVNDLKRIKDVNIMKTVMNTCNEEKKTLMVIAFQSDFPHIKRLLAVIEGNDAASTASAACALGRYQEGFNMYDKVLKKRREILGPDNPSTLITERDIAVTFYKQRDYSTALHMLKKIHEKQKEVLGSKNKYTLKTEEHIALTLHRQGKNEEALGIFRRVSKLYEEVLGVNDAQVLDCKFHMALALDGTQNYNEALHINYEVFGKMKKEFGVTYHMTLAAQNNIAMVLNNQGKMDEALIIYQDVFRKKKYVLGKTHPETLNTMRSMTFVLLKQEKYNKALENHQHVFEIQKHDLGLCNLLTLQTQMEIADIFLAQRRMRKALKIYKEIIQLRRNIVGFSDPVVLAVTKKVNMIEMTLKFFGDEETEVSITDVHKAMDCGENDTLEEMFKCGLDINYKDSEGTLLHYAVHNSLKDITHYLLKKGVNFSLICNNGNTPLHLASSKGHIEILEILLQHVKLQSFNKMHDFVNTKSCSGSTALHVAADINVVKILLKNGAVYDIINKAGERPIDLSKDPAITSFLKLIDSVFKSVQNGNSQIIHLFLSHLHVDEISAVLNSHNRERKTLTQVAIQNNHNDLACEFVEILKCPKTYETGQDIHIFRQPKMLYGNETEAEEYMINELSKDIIGDRTGSHQKLRRAEEFINRSQEIYYQAMQAYKEILKIKECSYDHHSLFIIENIFHSIHGLLTDKDSDLDMNWNMPRNNVCKIVNAFEEKYVIERMSSMNGRQFFNCRDPEPTTLLHHAVNNFQSNLVKVLLENGADCTLVSDKGNLPLHIASSKGFTEIVKILLHHIKVINVSKLHDFVNKKTVTCGNTALHVAANVSVANILLKYGAMYDTVNKKGERPVDISKDLTITHLLKLIDHVFEEVNNGNYQIIKKLYHLNFEEFTAVANARNNSGKTMSQIAILNKHHDLACKLIEVLKHRESQSNTCATREVHFINRNDDEIIKVHKHIDELCKQIQNESSICKWRRASLCRIKELFIQHQHMYDYAIKIYKKIQQTENDLLGSYQCDAEDSSALYEALNKKLTLGISKDENIYANFPQARILRADMEDNMETIQQKIENGFDVNFQDSTGRTALHYAVSYGKKDVIFFLLKKGADATLTSNIGVNPLHIAAKIDEELTEILLQYMEQQNKSKLQNFVNAKSLFGSTALHNAANIRIVKVLLKYGAMYDVPNKQGKVPLDLSRVQGVTNMLKLVEDIFGEAKSGNCDILLKLKHVEPDTFCLLTNTLNCNGKTVIDVLVDCHYYGLATQIIMQKNLGQMVHDIEINHPTYSTAQASITDESILKTISLCVVL